MLDELLSVFNPPPHPNVGEAYFLHQTLSAFYFLRAKALLYEAHCQSDDLRNWWKKACEGAFEPIIKEMTELMQKHGLPLPPSLPEANSLTDQFMATDGAAMVKGMIEAHVRGLQVARRPDVALLYNKLLQSALFAGADLIPIIEREGWVGPPPSYPSAAAHT